MVMIPLTKGGTSCAGTTIPAIRARIPATSHHAPGAKSFFRVSTRMPTVMPSCMHPVRGRYHGDLIIAAISSTWTLDPTGIQNVRTLRITAAASLNITGDGCG